MNKDNSCPGHHTIVSSPSAGKSVFMAKQTWELMRGFNSQPLNCRQPKRPTNETA